MFHFLRRTITTPKRVSFPINLCAWLPSRFTSAPSSSSSSEGNNTSIVSYLVGTFGYSPERASSVSKRLRLETREKPDAVLAFLKNHGLSETRALRVLRSAPALLRANPDKSLQPKFEFFKSKGFSRSDIVNIVVGCPHILGRSLNNEIIPCFDFFSNLFQSKHKLMKAVTSFSGILFDLGKRLEPNIKLLREEGIPESHIVRFIEHFPRSLKASPIKFQEAVREVKGLGIDPLRLQFVVVVHVKIHACKSTRGRKEGIYRKWGWTDDDISSAFRSNPWCALISDDKIEAVMDFLVNRLGYKSSDIARCPLVLSLSLEKRIIPRGSVIQVLLSKGLVKKLSLGVIFKCNDMVFLDRFIYCHVKEADELLKLYRAKLA